MKTPGQKAAEIVGMFAMRFNINYYDKDVQSLKDGIQAVIEDKPDKPNCLPCPFCKESKTEIEKDCNELYFVKCTLCYARGPKVSKHLGTTNKADLAILAWNTR